VQHPEFEFQLREEDENSSQAADSAKDMINKQPNMSCTRLGPYWIGNFGQTEKFLKWFCDDMVRIWRGKREMVQVIRHLIGNQLRTQWDAKYESHRQ
jgi:hypothetical protein